MKKVSKHVWRHKRKYGGAGAAVSLVAFGAALGIQAYASGINYNPVTNAQMAQMKRDQQNFLKRLRKYDKKKKV